MPALLVDLAARRVHVRGREVHLTRSEFDLLAALGRRPGTVVSKDDLARAVGAGPGRAGHRAVEVHIANLRRKLGEGREHPPTIRTVRGRGYLLEREAAEFLR